MSLPDTHLVSYQHYLQGGGEMGELTRAYNWSGTIIGAPDTWSQSLLTTVSIILSSRFPMFLWWGPDLIQFYNDAYRPSLGNNGKHPHALGQRGEDCWQEIWPVIKPLIDQVLNTGEPTWSEDQLIPIYRNNRLEDVYWTFGYSAVIDETGKPAGVLVICNETTDKVNSYNALKEAKQQLEISKAETERERDRLKRFVMQAPEGICVLTGPDLVFELVNPAYQEILSGRDLVGRPIFEALPELKGGPINELLDNVYNTGRLYVGTEVHIHVARYEGAPLEDRYFNFSYIPRLDADDKVEGILVYVFEVTDMVMAKRKVEESESRFRSMIEQSPVALLVNKGEDLIFEVINQPMIDIIGKGGDVKGKSWHEAIPELIGQPIVDRLYHTYRTGEEWSGIEVPIVREIDGKIETRFYNLVYKPLIEDGQITGLLQSAVDVTEQVTARVELEKIKDTLALSLNAAELGTFDLNLEKGIMHWDARCRTLFGISHQEDVTYEHDFVMGLHPDDRDRVLDVIDKVYIKSVSDGNYDVEYRTVGFEDKKVRWVRAKGKTYFDADDKPVRFIGAVLDITEQKNDELRKSDFIGMVSHELKTPLTSLMALVQVMHSKISKQGDVSSAMMLESANKQVKKMSAMINSFLNVSRLESGKIMLHKTDFDMVELISEVVEETKLMSPSHNVVLQPCVPVTANADREKIGAVISNLLSNAVKYSPRGKNIMVDCRVLDGHIKVSVQDEGMGIKPTDISRVFERYYRIESNHRQQISGFGIGLYLSAEIIKRHGGDIGAESEHGEGSTFWFTLALV